MKRLLVLAAAAIAALLAFHHPAPPPAIAAAPPAPSQHFREGHPSRTASPGAVVYVVGAVAHPGLYRVRAGARINDAIERAGGLRTDADPVAVDLAERVNDGEEIHVLRMGETAPAAVRRTHRKRSARASVPGAPIDLNSAGESALSGIPGIGRTLAQRIVAYRRINGPFASLDELADVAGMTQRRIDEVSAYVAVGSMP